MEPSIFAVYKACLEKQYKVSGEMFHNGYVVRVDFGTVGEWDDWIDHWIFNKDEERTESNVLAYYYGV